MLAVFSDAIVTGEGAKNAPALSLDWEKVEATLKRVDGVSAATLDAPARRIHVTYAGPFSGLDKVKNAVQNAELIDPAKVIFRPMASVDDDAKVTAALKGIAGVRQVVKEYNDFILYADLSTLNLDQVTGSAGVKGMIATHEILKVTLPASGGNATSLLDELSRTKWVLKAEIEAASNTLKVLAVKGRVTRAVVKSVMTQCGFPETK